MWTAIAIGILIVFVVIAVVTALRSDAGWRGWLLYQITRVYCPLMFRWRANNECTIPEHGPAIIIANHTSPVDPMLIWTRHNVLFRKRSTRVIGYMMAKEYFEQPGIIRWICRAMESIPVERDGRDMAPVKQALTRLKEGKLLGIFPEGGINPGTPDTRLLPASTGAAWLALTAQVPVIPVFIHDAPRSENMVRCFYMRTKVRVTYGSPIDLSQWTGKRKTQDLLKEVADHLMKSLAQLGGIEFTSCRDELRDL